MSSRERHIKEVTRYLNFERGEGISQQKFVSGWWMGNNMMGGWALETGKHPLAVSPFENY